MGVAIAPARFWADSPRAESFSQFVSTSRTQVKCRLSRAPVAVQAAHAADGETEVVGLQHFYPTDLLRHKKKTPVESDRGIWQFDSIPYAAKSGLLHAWNRRGRRGFFGAGAGAGGEMPGCEAGVTVIEGVIAALGVCFEAPPGYWPEAGGVPLPGGVGYWPEAGGVPLPGAVGY